MQKRASSCVEAAFVVPGRHSEDTNSDRRFFRSSVGWKCDTLGMTTAASTSLLFEPDRCANCFGPLPHAVKHKPALFCSDLCHDFAKDIRYWRATRRDGRFENDPTVREALNTRIAHLLAGGYNATARTIRPEVRGLVIKRDKVCVQCGAPGEQIDHIDGDSNDPGNLQFLCKSCHQAKTESRMAPASPEQSAFIDRLERERVLPDEPTQLCDDETFWRRFEQILRSERLDRIRWPELAARDSSEALIASAQAQAYLRSYPDDSGEEDDYAAHGIDDDSGFGPDSYFARAMNNDY